MNIITFGLICFGIIEIFCILIAKYVPNDNEDKGYLYIKANVVNFFISTILSLVYYEMGLDATLKGIGIIVSALGGLALLIFIKCSIYELIIKDKKER